MFNFGRRKPRPAAASPAPGAGSGAEEDPALEALRAAVRARREQAAALQLELFELESFAAEVEARLGALQQHLEALRARWEDVRLRRQWGTWRPTPEPERHGFGPRPAAPATPPPPATPEEAAGEAEIKALYRTLAKRFHPDLGTEGDDKPWRERLMSQVNAAYAARDLAALRALGQQPERPPQAPAPRAALQAELERLDGVIAGLERTLDEWAGSPAVQLKLDASLARSAGRDLLSEFEAELRAEIARLEAELEAG